MLVPLLIWATDIQQAPIMHQAKNQSHQEHSREQDPRGPPLTELTMGASTWSAESQRLSTKPPWGLVCAGEASGSRHRSREWRRGDHGGLWLDSDRAPA